MKILFRIFIVLLRLGVTALIGWGIFTLVNEKARWMEVILLFLYVPSILASILIFINRKRSVTKIAWLFIVLLIPVIGPLLYIVFAGRYKYSLSYKKFLKKYDFTNKHQPKSIKESNLLLQEIANYTHKPIVKGNITNTRKMMDSFLELFNDMRSAKKFIHLHYYIIKRSEIWDEMREILLKKVNEGVEIRLIVDDFGSWTLPWHDLRHLRKKGINIEIFNKISSPFISSEDLFRTHRKSAIIDGNIAYIGGANVSDEYISYSSKYGVWEDVVTKLTGTIVKTLSLLFINDWYFVTNKKIDINKFAPEPKDLDGGTSMIMVEPTPEVKEPIAEDILISLIYRTKKIIRVSTPYFVPTAPVMKALKVAIRRGVKVQIYIPGLADKRIVLSATKIYAKQLIALGAEVKQLKGKFLHSKIGIFDEIGFTGTSNIDFRSMQSQLENNLFFIGDKVKELEELFNYYDEGSKKLTLDTRRNAYFYNTFKASFIKIIAPMM